ncbi:hypothetical protein HDU67_000159 [Dinochytrium kinnereticum]|nr:hypothetical protein HDU67_000159 [Dinochytrium kinnereticum]
MDSIYQPVAVYPTSASQKAFVGFGNSKRLSTTTLATLQPTVRPAFPSPPLPSPATSFPPHNAATPQFYNHHPHHQHLAGPSTPLSPDVHSRSPAIPPTTCATTQFPFPFSPMGSGSTSPVAESVGSFNGFLPEGVFVQDMSSQYFMQQGSAGGIGSVIFDEDRNRPVKRPRTRSVSSVMYVPELMGSSSSSGSPVVDASNTTLYFDDLMMFGMGNGSGALLPSTQGVVTGGFEASAAASAVQFPILPGSQNWAPTTGTPTQQEMMMMMASFGASVPNDVASLASPGPSTDLAPPVMMMTNAPLSPVAAPFPISQPSPVAMISPPSCPPSPPLVATPSSPPRKLKRKKSVTTAPAVLIMPAVSPAPVSPRGPVIVPGLGLAPPSAEGAGFEQGGEECARPQKLRFDGDLYTPAWVRLGGHLKEGLCELCPKPGKWLQLKNSAFWYHKQFLHGISSVSGVAFTAPLDLRVVFLHNPTSESSTKNPDPTLPPTQVITVMVEGLCHECNQWHPLMNSKRRCTIPLHSSTTPDDPFPASLERLSEASEGNVKVLAPRHPASGSILLPTAAALEWATGEPGASAGQRHHHHLPTSAAQDVRGVLDSAGMTVMWFRHAHKCHVYERRKGAVGEDGQEEVEPVKAPTKGKAKTSKPFAGSRKSPLRTSVAVAKVEPAVPFVHHPAPAHPPHGLTGRGAYEFSFEPPASTYFSMPSTEYSFSAGSSLAPQMFVGPDGAMPSPPLVFGFPPDGQQSGGFVNLMAR